MWTLQSLAYTMALLHACIVINVTQACINVRKVQSHSSKIIALTRNFFTPCIVFHFCSITVSKLNSEIWGPSNKKWIYARMNRQIFDKILWKDYSTPQVKGGQVNTGNLRTWWYVTNREVKGRAGMVALF